VNVRFDVYGGDAAALNIRAAGILEDFGPHLTWTWDITAVQVVDSPYWLGHVTAESTPT
jgi:hypothetical protein